MISILFLKKILIQPQYEKMNPHNRGFDPKNPWAFQETPSPASNRPIAPFLMHSTMPDMTGYASFISSRLKNDVSQFTYCVYKR